MVSTTHIEIGRTSLVVVSANDEGAINTDGDKYVEYFQVIVDFVGGHTFGDPRGKRLLRVLGVLGVFFLFDLPLSVVHVCHLEEGHLLVEDYL